MCLIFLPASRVLYLRRRCWVLCYSQAGFSVSDTRRGACVFCWVGTSVASMRTRIGINAAFFFWCVSGSRCRRTQTGCQPTPSPSFLLPVSSAVPTPPTRCRASKTSAKPRRACSTFSLQQCSTLLASTLLTCQV